MKNQKYLEMVGEQNPGLEKCCFFEVAQGQGNVFDLIREGKFTKMSNNTFGAKRLQKVTFKTFLMKKLCILMDDLILFTPKSDENIRKAMMSTQSDRNLKFSSQELGLYEKMLDQLRVDQFESEFHQQ